MKEKLQNINKLSVLKTFVAAHVYMVVAIAVVALLYVVIASVAGKNSAEIVSYAQNSGIFSVLGILSVLVSMAAVYHAVSVHLFKKGGDMAACIALEILFIIFALFLYFAVSQFNVLSYLVVMLVPTIISYYVTKNKK